MCRQRVGTEDQLRNDNQRRLSPLARAWCRIQGEPQSSAPVCDNHTRDLCQPCDGCPRWHMWCPLLEPLVRQEGRHTVPESPSKNSSRPQAVRLVTPRRAPRIPSSSAFPHAAAGGRRAAQVPAAGGRGGSPGPDPMWRQALGVRASWLNAQKSFVCLVSRRRSCGFPACGPHDLILPFTCLFKQIAFHSASVSWRDRLQS